MAKPVDDVRPSGKRKRDSVEPVKDPSTVQMETNVLLERCMDAIRSGYTYEYGNDQEGES